MKSMSIFATALVVIIFAFTFEADAKGRRVSRETKPQVADLSGDSWLVARARAYVGTNPTGWGRVWCGRFLRMVLPNDPGKDYDRAAAYARLGRPGRAGAGALVVWPHHVGIIVRTTRPGHAIVISGNDGPRGNRAVLERERPLAGAIAYRHL